MKRHDMILLAALAVGCAPKDEGSSASGSTGETGEGDGDGDGDVPAACAAAGWDTSLAAYEALAEQNNDTYWYSTFTAEWIDDFQWACLYRTTTEFVDGAPMRRELALEQVGEDTLPEECTGVPFIEEGDEVGSNAGGFAFPAYTMEQLYEGCCDLLALEPADMYSDNFEVDAAGVVDQCYAIENGCGEGCEASVDGFAGFRLEGFGFGSPP